MRERDRSVLRFLSVLIVTAVTAVSCISCSVFRGPAMTGTKAAPEIIRLVVAAINDKNSLSDSYSAIPERQRGDVSFSYFTQYTDIVRSLMRQGGTDKVASFRILSEGETEEAIGSSDRFGCAELLFDSERRVPLYIVYETDEAGNCVLSFSWISGIINIYNYAQHYFSMLDSGNIDGIYAILRPGYTDEIYTDDVVYAKAAALSEFYMVKVKSLTSQYLISELTPDRLEVVIPRVLDNGNANMITHEVSFRSSGDAYIINDSIEQEPDLMLSYVTGQDGARLLRCGATYSYRNVLSQLGRPMNVSYSSEITGYEEGSDGEIIEIHKIIVNYKGMLLVFEGYGDDRYNWEGTLVSVSVWSNGEYLLGNGVTGGISQSDLLVIYPYLDLSDYHMAFRNSFGSNQEVHFEISEDNMVSSIRVDQVS